MRRQAALCDVHPCGPGAEMASHFWGEFQRSGSMEKACPKTIEYARSNPADILSYLGNSDDALADDGGQSRGYPAEDACPFKSRAPHTIARMEWMIARSEPDERPTAYPEVNAVLRDLLEGVRNILGGRLLGMYLEGSLANGDFDEDSDIDFVVVTTEEIPEEILRTLYALHERINLLDTQWSTNLEGSYIPQEALRRFDPQQARHPNIERGHGERLKKAAHDESWNVHRFLLRERGITILGPALKTWIDPISPDDLRQAMLPALHGWATHILNHPHEIARQGYQSYTVLSLCRIWYTLEFGDVVSKRRAAGWVRETQDRKWHALIDRAWAGRHHPQLPASSEEIHQTLDLIRSTLERGEEFSASRRS
jgi:hypothetical protein